MEDGFALRFGRFCVLALRVSRPQAATATESGIYTGKANYLCRPVRNVGMPGHTGELSPKRAAEGGGRTYICRPERETGTGRNRDRPNRPKPEKSSGGDATECQTV